MKERTTRLLSVALVTTAVALGIAYLVIPKRTPKPPNSNSLMVVAPYHHAGTWVFDDAGAGLEREPFVAGVPEMIDQLVAGIPNAKEGFRLLFSAQPFPGYQKKLQWTRGDKGGNYYRMDDPPMEGWLCPALFKYYEKPPRELYVKAEAAK